MGNLLNINQTPPIPTLSNPLVQVDWIFEKKMRSYNNRSTKENFACGRSYYKKFLTETFNYNESLKRDPCFYIEKEWDKVALYKFCKWIETTNIEGTAAYLTSNTIVGLVSALRIVMEDAYECGFIENAVLNVSLPPAVRETDARAAFSTEEYESIFKIVTPQIQFSKNLLKPYKKTGVGRDPRYLIRKGLEKGGKVLYQGWACYKPSDDGLTLVVSDDNIRWYFENLMNCQPLAGTPLNKLTHNSFFNAAANIHGGLPQLYQKWGVSTFIDIDILMPLVVKLIAETGMNVDSILSLKRDCLKQTHPLTNLPYVEYDKPRSGGEKVLPLELYNFYDSQGQYLGLGQKQSLIIAETINLILKLTEPLVALADSDEKDYLLIYQSSGVNKFGKVKRINNKNAGSWTNVIVSKNNLTSKDGKKLAFNLSRFRPTKITEFVRQGFDIFQIMSIAGHSSIQMTLSYVDGLKITSVFDQTINKELTNIKNNTLEWKTKTLPVATLVVDNPQNFIFKTSLCHCKNPYDPPPQVKKAKYYNEGDACTYWNMCLQCPNVLITEKDLPTLISYKNEIARSMRNGVEDMPRQGELYKKTLMLLEEILTPDFMFTEENLIDASNKITDGNVIDPFIY